MKLECVRLLGRLFVFLYCPAQYLSLQLISNYDWGRSRFPVVIYAHCLFIRIPYYDLLLLRLSFAVCYLQFEFSNLLTCEFSDVTGTNISSNLTVQFEFTCMYKWIVRFSETSECSFSTKRGIPNESHKLINKLSEQPGKIELSISWPRKGAIWFVMNMITA
jgi:hypothetical protein